MTFKLHQKFATLSSKTPRPIGNIRCTTCKALSVEFSQGSQRITNTDSTMPDNIIKVVTKDLKLKRYIINIMRIYIYMSYNKYLRSDNDTPSKYAKNGKAW